MLKTRHRWFLFSLAHPLFSTLCLFLGSTITGGPSGWIGYVAALLAFLINLPGVFLVRPFFQVAVSETDPTRDYFCFAMIVSTWLFVVVPVCYLTSRFLSNRAVR